MNNKIIAAAIVALAGAFAFNASAQQADNTAATCNNNKQCTLGKRAAGPTAFNPFEGINLSKDQESKLQALRLQCQADRKAAREQDKAERRKACNDQRRKMLKDIKAVLSPEQYVQFLENNFVNRGQKFKDGKKDRARMDKKKFLGNRMRRTDAQRGNDANQNK